MDVIRTWPLAAFIAIAWALALMIAFGVVGERITRLVDRLPLALRMILPCLCSVPYILVAVSFGEFRWEWCAIYFELPVLVALLLWRARVRDRQQRGTIFDALMLLLLGLAVDLRWFEAAWPHSLAFVGKLVLVDVGLYGFVVIRQMSGIGYDLRIRLRDLAIGLREAAFLAPVIIVSGLALHFLKWHARIPRLGEAAFAWAFTFLFIAIPEELYFRGWMQNLLERRIGKWPALFLAAAIFGLAHFNKRTAFFNWRYVLLAALAGIFYGRAWRQHRRVAASAITHATTDAIWSLWFRV